jgi:glutathione S-transferase
LLCGRHMNPSFVDLETARSARGLRLLVIGTVPSPWSEAAKAILHVKALPFVAVRWGRSNAEAVAPWTGARNAPVALYDDEPPRTGWAEILALAQRLGGARSLVPAEPEARVRLHGLAHELAGEGGLGWCTRLMMIHAGLTTGGTRGFPVPIAQYLATRYGYTPARGDAAKDRIAEVTALFARQLAASTAAGHGYLLGADLSALDLYLATFLTTTLGVSDVECPELRPELRPAFASLRDDLADAIPPTLVAHRARIFERHLGWPIVI